MIEKLKNFQTDSHELDELVQFRASARLMTAEFSAQSIASPKWLTNVSAILDKEIADKVRSERQRQLEEAKAKRASLRTPEEKRADLDGEISQLEGLLK